MITPDDLEDMKETVDLLTTTVMNFIESKTDSNSVRFSVCVSALMSYAFHSKMSKEEFFYRLLHTWHEIEEIRKNE